MDHVKSSEATDTGRIIVQLSNGLIIREYKHSDAAALARHATNKKIWDNLRNRMPHPYTEADSVFWINTCQDKANHVRSGKWTAETGGQGPALPTAYAIEVNGDPAGSIGLDLKDDINFRCAEVGYWLGEEYWGKGIMSKLVPAFVEWAWETFGILIRLDGVTAEQNVVSGKLLQKAGFQYEGRRPNSCVKNGVIGTELFWGALRPE